LYDLKGIKISISIPIDGPEDQIFLRRGCGGSHHLGQRENLYLRDNNLAAIIERTVGIVTHGIEIRKQYLQTVESK